MTNFSKQVYDSLHTAFEHFNTELFDGKLPPVIIVLHRKRNARGYFWNNQWHRADDKGDVKVPEIALNPESMGRNAKEVLSTLVHEMVHHEQYAFGKPPATAYHNKEWASMMDAVGLTPSTTAAPGGARTGRNCSHYIAEGGPFDQSCDRLLKRNDFDIGWFTVPGATVKKADKSKVKHSCPECNANVWCKEGLYIVCGDCDEQMVPA